MSLNKVYSVLVLLMLSFAGCLGVETVDNCMVLRADFDDYVERSELPIIENSSSLCHGMDMSVDFSELEPRWAVGKLTSIDLEDNSLVFDGVNRTMEVWWPTSIQEDNYEIGSYYKIDMNNVCRSFFMLVDSRYPSPISSTFVKPEKISCSG